MSIEYVIKQLFFVKPHWNLHTEQKRRRAQRVAATVKRQEKCDPRKPNHVHSINFRALIIDTTRPDNSNGINLLQVAPRHWTVKLLTIVRPVTICSGLLQTARVECVCVHSKLIFWYCRYFCSGFAITRVRATALKRKKSNSGDDRRCSNCSPS